MSEHDNRNVSDDISAVFKIRGAAANSVGSWKALNPDLYVYTWAAHALYFCPRATNIACRPLMRQNVVATFKIRVGYWSPR